MLNKDLVFLMNVVEVSNVWKMPIHWDAKAQRLHFNPKLKLGFYISNFAVLIGLVTELVFLGSRTLIPNSDPVPIFIFIFNILATVAGIFTVFIQQLQYTCGTELLSFFVNIDTIKVNLRNRGMRGYAGLH
jgi:hypothetical protein